MIANDLPEYPLPLRQHSLPARVLRIDHRAYLTSRLRLLAPPAVRCLAFELICVSLDQMHPGTLPIDQAELAKLCMIDAEQFKSLMLQEVTPLEGWTLVNCAGEKRHAHPVLLDMIRVRSKRPAADKFQTAWPAS